MSNVKEYPLSADLPFLKDGSILYISNGQYQVLDSGIGNSFELYSGMFECSGYRFLSLQKLFAEFSADLLGYLFPGADLKDSGSVMERIQKECFGGRSHTGFVRNDNGRLRFAEVGEESVPADVNGLIAAYLLQIGDRSHDEIRFRVTTSKERDDVLFEVPTEYSKVPPAKKLRKADKGIAWSKRPIGRAIDEKISEIFDSLDDSERPRKKTRKAPDGRSCPAGPHSETEVETPLDERARAILRELERIQSKYNISIEELDVIMGYRVKLSHLHITPAGKIILTDFDNAEVKIDDLSKAVFFLYLKHPEGISYYDLDSHRSELMDLYMGITGKDDQESIDRSIDSLVDRYNNSINVKVSRVKAAFRSVVSDRIAKFYYIDGPQGGTKKIPIDRDLVIWEH